MVIMFDAQSAKVTYPVRFHEKGMREIGDRVPGGSCHSESVISLRWDASILRSLTALRTWRLSSPASLPSISSSVLRAANTLGVRSREPVASPIRSRRIAGPAGPAGLVRIAAHAVLPLHTSILSGRTLLARVQKNKTNSTPGSLPGVFL